MRREDCVRVYDFDKTIFKHESYSRFYLYCLVRRPYIIFLLPCQLIVLALLFLRIIPRGKGKELFSVYLRFTGNNERLAGKFWKKNAGGIKKWYLGQKRSDDVIISASPEFFLRPITDKLNVSLIGTRMDSRTGKINGENCYGKEKPRRFREIYGETVIECFYSDSYSDLPMAKIAREAVMVKGDDLRPFFGNEKPERKKK